jgi:hypothetical protein
MLSSADRRMTLQPRGRSTSISTRRPGSSGELTGPSSVDQASWSCCSVCRSRLNGQTQMKWRSDHLARAPALGRDAARERTLSRANSTSGESSRTRRRRRCVGALTVRETSQAGTKLLTLRRRVEQASSGQLTEAQAHSNVAGLVRCLPHLALPSRYVRLLHAAHCPLSRRSGRGGGVQEQRQPERQIPCGPTRVPSRARGTPPLLSCKSLGSLIR